MSTANSPPGIGRSRECWPIQDTILSALVRCSKTTSRGASISSEVEKSGIIPLDRRLSSVLRLGGSLERCQVGRPELVEEVPHRGQPVGAGPEQGTGGLALLGDEGPAPGGA